MANPFVHIELSTDDVGDAKKFYKKLFGWNLTDMPTMQYTMIDAGKNKTGGGIAQKTMAGQPTAWLPYVEVDSVKKTIAKAQKAGANVVVPFQPIGEMGAVGVFIDPAGAALGVWETAAKKPAAKATKPAAKKATKAKPVKVAKPAKKAAKKAAKKK